MKLTRRTLKLLAVLAVCVSGLVAMAGPAAAFVNPTFATQPVYLHCNGPTKFYQLNWAAAAGDESSFVPWDSHPPSGSVTDGNGCSGADVGWVTNEVYDVTFQGTFTGNLRDLTVDIHEFLLGNTRQDASTIKMRAYGEIDGTAIFPAGTTSGAYDGRSFTVTPMAENSGVTNLIEFSVTNLGYANPVYDQNNNLIDVQTGGVALEDGDGTTQHTLKLMFGVDAFPGDDPPTGIDAWCWDTTEVPSGITFNPPELAADTVTADLPSIQK